MNLTKPYVLDFEDEDDFNSLVKFSEFSNLFNRNLLKYYEDLGKPSRGIFYFYKDDSKLNVLFSSERFNSTSHFKSKDYLGNTSFKYILDPNGFYEFLNKNLI